MTQIIEKTISAAMYSALASHDLGCATAFQSIYPEPEDQSVAGQICAANRFWRSQLGSASECTIEARACLLDINDHEDWLTLFSDEVVPVVARLQLPKAG